MNKKRIICSILFAPQFLYNLVKYGSFLMLKALYLPFNKLSYQNKIPKRVFIIPQKFLGDIVINSQIFSNLLQLNPNIKFVVLQYQSSVFEKIYTQRLGKNLEKIISYKKGDNLFDKLNEIKELGHFDFVIRFASSSFRRSIFALFVKSFKKYTIVRQKKMITTKIPEGVKIKQNIANENYLQYCNNKINKILGTQFSPSFFLPQVQHDLDKSFAISDKYVVICPGASFEAKMWHSENFNKLAVYLSSIGFKIALIEGNLPHEKNLPNIIYHDYLLKASTPFDAVFNIIAKANLLISNDSGFAHISVALNTKTLVIPCFMSMEMYGYPFLPHFYTLTPSVSCYPCNVPSINKNCYYYKADATGKPRCIDTQSYNNVKQIVDKILCQ